MNGQELDKPLALNSRGNWKGKAMGNCKCWKENTRSQGTWTKDRMASKASGTKSNVGGRGSKQFHTTWFPSISWVSNMLSRFSHVWLCDSVDRSLPGSSVHRILQARILEWVAILFSRGSSRPRDLTQVSCIAGGFFTIWTTRGVCCGKPQFWHSLPRDRASDSTGISISHIRLLTACLQMPVIIPGYHPCFGPTID